jgi:hypothetical protein
MQVYQKVKGFRKIQVGLIDIHVSQVCITLQIYCLHLKLGGIILIFSCDIENNLDVAS